MKSPSALCAALLCLAAFEADSAPLAEDRFRFGGFGEVTLYPPAATPEQVVLFLSGDGGWNLGVVRMAERLRGLGALVVGIDIRRLFHNLNASAQACTYPAGDLEELSRAVQVHLRLPSYKAPILVGYSSGATLVYGVLAQAPPEAFAGGISLGFCRDIQAPKPLCRGRGLTSQPRQARPLGFDLAPMPELGVPWFVLQGDADRVCDPEATRRFVEQVGSGHLFALPKVGHGFAAPRSWDAQYAQAYLWIARAGREAPAALAPGALDLPLVEVPARGAATHDMLAVILTGDGGWATIDKGVADSLAARGIPVVGWNSLKYYWTPRTPEAAANDLDRILKHYLSGWHKPRALVVGYSFGADVLPFLVARLPPATRSLIAGVALLGLARHASFEFHITHWLGGEGDSRYPTIPELERLRDVHVTCIHGAEEKDSACSELGHTGARVVSLPGGHHLGGDYAKLGEILLAGLEGAGGR